MLLMLLLTFNENPARSTLTQIRADGPLHVSGLKCAVLGLFLQLLNLLELNLLVFGAFPQLIFLQKCSLGFNVFNNIHAVLVQLRLEGRVKFIWVLFFTFLFNLTF